MRHQTGATCFGFTIWHNTHSVTSPGPAVYVLSGCRLHHAACSACLPAAGSIGQKHQEVSAAAAQVWSMRASNHPKHLCPATGRQRTHSNYLQSRIVVVLSVQRNHAGAGPKDRPGVLCICMCTAAAYATPLGVCCAHACAHTHTPPHAHMVVHATLL